MPEGWERLARDDALWAIDPNLAGADIGEFRAAGKARADWAVEWAAPARRDRALEIGVGIGRTVVHLAEHFASVDGVDVSPTMVALATEHGLPPNVTLSAAADLAAYPDKTFDFVFSHLVFQHIEDDEIVASYLKDIARVLAGSGRAVLQFDTRQLGRAARALRRLPDPLLPRSRRRHMRRVPRSAEWIRERIPVSAEQGAGTDEFWVLA